MMSLIGRIKCAVTRKHLRGKFIEEKRIGSYISRTLQCERCKSTWTRVVKLKAETALKVA